MKVNLRDVLILLDCAKYCLRIVNPSMSWDREAILDAHDRVFNQTKDVFLVVEKEEETK
jgi:hypothetical protein